MSKRNSSGLDGGTERIKELQGWLRRLGYIGAGIDGVYGRGTERAVMALRYDLLNNTGKGPDGTAPVAVKDYCKARVAEVNGSMDEGLAGCIADMLADEKFPKVPGSDNPAAENARIEGALNAIPRGSVPVPFLRAVLRQESGLRHYAEPTKRDADHYVVVGLDRGATGSPAVTSRGYGVGQVTLFHHPPSPSEVRDLLVDIEKNVAAAARLLESKFVRFVAGRTAGTRADDRQAEAGRGPLRRCRYGVNDSRFMADCQRCVREAGTTKVVAGVTPLYEGSTATYAAAPLYPAGGYPALPTRKNIPCDWPYAVRRYNGSGLNSYHYQAKILLNVLAG